ncbi:hypothetical protein K490DRAFT_35448 [Saccharata proteae CBS 121410]|uniref:P-loop containing nucleoside triphosphate hydrolase protein n=1 Tax=Saccharata proteae CBS 121410 TaxID=1314787 RepID=A0A9P4HYF1_9PEZI|nr:hypothetical protein K490DRAFT_35448 [Saccharata proteae CBS 121410]
MKLTEEAAQVGDGGVASTAAAAVGAASGEHENAFSLRSYQQEMVEQSLQQNIIVAMDTGSGKTHIAISRAAAELEICAPDQLVWFLAPTVTLCEQQYHLFVSALPAYQARLLTGADGVDSWKDQSVWDGVLCNIRVVVSTPAVLLDALIHGFVKLGGIALLIFDEAHNCRGDHSSHRVMRDFYQPAMFKNGQDGVPKILGLTASPVINAKANGLEVIEKSLNAITRSPKTYRTELLQFTHQPNLVKLVYPGGTSDVPVLPTALRYVHQGLNIDEDPYIVQLAQQVRQCNEENKTKLRQKLNLTRLTRKTFVQDQLQQLYSRAMNMNEELGTSAADYYMSSCIDRFLQNVRSGVKASTELTDEEQTYLCAQFEKILHLVPPGPSAHVWDKLSPKVQTLVDLLRRQHAPDFKGLVFVEQRATVAVLEHILSVHPDLQGLYRPGTFVGVSGNTKRKFAIGELVQMKHQQQTLEDFKAGKRNLIIATNVLEEGIDVSSCNTVISFDMPKNIKSFIQRRGRARKKESTFVIMCQGDSEFAGRQDQWQTLEEKMKENYLNDLRTLREIEERESQEEKLDMVLQVQSTGARLTCEDAVQHLYHFCSVLVRSNDGFVDLRPRFGFQEDEGGFISSTVTLPTSVDAKVRKAQSRYSWTTERAARKDAAFQAYEALYKAGLVNDNLLPLHSQAPDFGKMETIASLEIVPSRMDPWIPVAKALAQVDGPSQWHRMLITISSADLEPMRIQLLLPCPPPSVSDFALYWNECTQLSVSVGAVDTVVLDAEGVKKLQMGTFTLLGSVYGSRMSAELTDFMALLWPLQETNVLGQNLDLASGVFSGWQSASEVIAALSPDDIVSMSTSLRDRGQIGLIRDIGEIGRPYLFHAFEMGPDNADIAPKLQVMGTVFPKRRDFLHPMNADAANNGMYTKIHSLPVETCVIDRMPGYLTRISLFMPSIFHRIELSMLAEELRSSILAPVQINNLDLVLQAVTASSTTEEDYQRLEFLGDCILKMCTSITLMSNNLSWPESYLAPAKDRIVSNGALARACRRAGLEPYIITQAFTGSKWRPRYVHDALASQTAPAKTRQESSKVLADVIESLIGASYIDGGLTKAESCIRTLLPSVNNTWRAIPSAQSILSSSYPSPPLPIHVEKLERLLGYTFKNKLILLEAITHPSFSSYREQTTSSYQRLEFLGDAVLDYIVTKRLYRHAPPLPHHLMHRIRTAVVNAAFLAHLCIAFSIPEPRTAVPVPGSPLSKTTSAADTTTDTTPTTPTPTTTPIPRALWQFMRHTSSAGAPASITIVQRATVARHALLGPAIDTALWQGLTYPWAALTHLRAEKFFSDLVEAVLGAIFVDSAAGGQEMGSKEGAGEEGFAAAEAFVRRIGVMGVLERVLKDMVDCLHPKERVGLLAGNERVVYEWVGEDMEATGPSKRGQFRCRVLIGGRVVGGWAEGDNRLDAEVAAAARAVVVLRKDAEEKTAGDGDGMDLVVGLGLDGQRNGKGNGDGGEGMEEHEGDRLDGEGDVEMMGVDGAVD